MSTLHRLLGVIAIGAALAAPASAQWPDWPTRNVPRTADGEPDLDAPAPRMPNGKPQRERKVHGALRPLISGRSVV